jgi:hypothetical protein
MPKDWGETPNCAPRREPNVPHPLEEFNYVNNTDDGICQQCDGTGENHGQLCKRCGGKGYLTA